MRNMMLVLAFFASFGLLVAGCTVESNGSSDNGDDKKTEEPTTKEKK